jgi:hypothetical protein
LARILQIWFKASPVAEFWQESNVCLQVITVQNIRLRPG